ncbi:MAG: FAD-binding domain-containing protein [Pseudomonadota bacterium]
MQVVWFKRDLRIEDHAPLAQASRQGPCVCLYVYEPDLISSEEFDSSHLKFINESLAELDAQLRKLGGQLTYRFGHMPDVLDQLHRNHPIDAIWSHEETGNRITYDRDQRVAKWAAEHHVAWHEIPQNGVVRRLKSRDGWSRQRTTWMQQPQASIPDQIVHPHDVITEKQQLAADLGLEETTKTQLQTGGTRAGKQILHMFLHQRGENYCTEMSSPNSAWNSCSRLSTYLAWGCLSMKSVEQAVCKRQAELRQQKASGHSTGGWLKSLRSYQSRLSWHCHFMQKLEDEPRIEFENMSCAYDGLREGEFNQNYFDAWCAGQTGYPMVDACMRAMRKHSWVNFRMRAMLVSFASYHLWLHWRPTAVYLAKHFLDFEPGIHFSQFQMQSGTTGINTVRIYSPIKQVTDQDPQGKFIRKHVPELAEVPNEYIAEPHKMPLMLQSAAGCRIGKDYPKPIVDHATAYRAARARVNAIRRQDQSRTEAKRVLQKHGSRKRVRGS